MTAKVVIDRLRAIDRYAGVAIYASGQELFSENIERDYTDVMLGLLHHSAGTLRVNVAARGFTFAGFGIEGYDVVLKLAGRFPVMPAICLSEPEFIDSSPAPALPSKDTARAEAEAALRAFGLVG